MVTFTSRPLFFRAKSLLGPRTSVDALGKREKCHLSCMEPRFLGCIARIRTELSEFAISRSVGNKTFELVAYLDTVVTSPN